MNLKDILFYTRKELEYLDLVNEEDNIITYKDNVGTRYVFLESKKGLKYLSTIKNQSRICNSWGN